MEWIHVYNKIEGMWHPSARLGILLRFNGGGNGAVEFAGIGTGRNLDQSERGGSYDLKVM